MVSEMRVPSSSSSESSGLLATEYTRRGAHGHADGIKIGRTDGDGLDPHALLDMGVLGVVGILALQDLLATECVDKSGTAWREC